MTTQRPCENLLLGISGSFHAVYTFAYLEAFRSVADRVRVIMTQSARTMVDSRPVSIFTQEPVFSDLWDEALSVRAPHIQLTRWADLFLVLPATADIIGKAANGIANDLLSTAILASPQPVLFAPAMNPTMWDSKALQRNLETLRADGHYIIPPADDRVSVTTGEWDQALGPPEPAVILRHLQHVRLRRLRDDYWEEATREPAKTPAAQLQEAVQPVVAP
jgi:phosphopantothenoylcysteine decarboxylase / phosphopantothenate---cysteine ligase